MLQIKNIKRVEPAPHKHEHEHEHEDGHGHDHKHGHHHHHHKPNKLRVFLLRLVYSNAYLALPILAITTETYLYLGEFTFNANFLGFIFFSTLFLYPFHRLFGIYTTAEFEHTKAQKEVVKHPTLTRVSVILGFIGTVFFTFQLPLSTLSYLIPLGIISIAYSIHFIPTFKGWMRLRDIPGIKIYAITLVATFTTATIPLISSGEVGSTDIWLLSIQRFLFILAITIPFDVRDAHLDKRWNLKTIPLILGNERAITLAISLLYVSALLVVFQYFYTGYVGIEIVIANFIAAGFTHFILHDFKNKNSYLYNAFLIEGAMVYHFALVTIAVILSDLL